MDASKLNDLLKALPAVIDTPPYQKAIDKFIKDMSPSDVMVTREDMKKVLMKDQILATHFLVKYIAREDYPPDLLEDNVSDI